jgi:hypothetical protein
MDRGRNRSQRYRKVSREVPYREYEYEARPRRRPHRERKVWPFLLMGCGLGIFFSVLAAAVIVFVAIRSSQAGGLGNIGVIGGTQTFTQENTQQVPLTTLSQMQVCDKIGNVMITVDPNATTDSATIATKKFARASGKSEAEQEFKRIAVEVQPPGSTNNNLACSKQSIPGATPTSNASSTTGNAAAALMVNITTPESGGFLQNSGDSVDVTITLPAAALPKNGPLMQLSVEAPVGKVTVDGLSGVLNIRGSTGDVVVHHAILADGSHIETAQGNVTFDGMLVVPPTNDTKNPARFVFLSEQGNIDVTLPSTTNVTLDANTNVGKINSEFDIKVQNSDEAASYHGALNASMEPQPATLVLDVSTGNVNIHKGQL